VGPDFIIIYRPVDDRPDPRRQLRPEVATRQGIEPAGATILNTGIGWHEARIPTIATSVPRGAFAWVTKKMRDELRTAGLTIPLITSNRINTRVAEQCSPATEW
jgi:2,4-dienoyl-CoA reductase (NADPH2)